MGFDITLIDDSTKHVDSADGYALEGPLTTFFKVTAGRTPRLDPWSERILSVRTERVAFIQRSDAPVAAATASIDA